MYTKKRDEFDRTAKFWTETYAKETSQEEKIATVCAMGFDRDQAKQALEKHAWDESAAVNALLGGLWYLWTEVLEKTATAIAFLRDWIHTNRRKRLWFFGCTECVEEMNHCQPLTAMITAEKY